MDRRESRAEVCCKAVLANNEREAEESDARDREIPALPFVTSLQLTRTMWMISPKASVTMAR